MSIHCLYLVEHRVVYKNWPLACSLGSGYEILKTMLNSNCFREEVIIQTFTCDCRYLYAGDWKITIWNVIAILSSGAVINKVSTRKKHTRKLKCIRKECPDNDFLMWQLYCDPHERTPDINLKIHWICQTIKINSFCLCLIKIRKDV